MCPAAVIMLSLAQLRGTDLHASAHWRVSLVSTTLSCDASPALGRAQLNSRAPALLLWPPRLPPTRLPRSPSRAAGWSPWAVRPQGRPCAGAFSHPSSSARVYDPSWLTTRRELRPEPLSAWRTSDHASLGARPSAPPAPALGLAACTRALLFGAAAPCCRPLALRDHSAMPRGYRVPLGEAACTRQVMPAWPCGTHPPGLEAARIDWNASPLPSLVAFGCLPSLRAT